MQKKPISSLLLPTFDCNYREEEEDAEAEKGIPVKREKSEGTSMTATHGRHIASGGTHCSSSTPFFLTHPWPLIFLSHLVANICSYIQLQLFCSVEQMKLWSWNSLSLK